MEYDRNDRRNPWPWVAIIVGMLIFLGASWWIATASTRGDEVVLLDEEQQRPTTTQPAQPGQQPTEQPSQQPTTTQPGTTQQPSVTEQQPPVNIYVERTPQRPEERPIIVIVPEGQTPRASDGTLLSEVDLPARFTYQGSTWEASDRSESPDTEDLTDTGASVNGNAIYVERDDRPPYDEVYVETEPGSGVYVKYTKRPVRRSS